MSQQLSGGLEPAVLLALLPWLESLDHAVPFCSWYSLLVCGLSASVRLMKEALYKAVKEKPALVPALPPGHSGDWWGSPCEWEQQLPPRLVGRTLRSSTWRQPVQMPGTHRCQAGDRVPSPCDQLLPASPGLQRPSRASQVRLSRLGRVPRRPPRPWSPAVLGSRTEVHPSPFRGLAPMADALLDK